jgi:hypothetical protein
MRHCVSVNVCKVHIFLSGWVTIPTFMRLHAAVRTSSALQATTHHHTQHVPPKGITTQCHNSVCEQVTLTNYEVTNLHAFSKW